MLSNAEQTTGRNQEDDFSIDGKKAPCEPDHTNTRQEHF